ncbi:MAG: large-conductance mechanosensitive channel protein MscL [Sphaerochaetaceae bacterium]
MREKTSGFLNEFKKFIAKGNVMDMAVGIIMGAAFTAIVSSLVKDILMPLIGLIVGGINFTNLKIVIRPATGNIAEAAITYGAFIQSILNFLLVSLVIFIMVRQLNKIRELAVPQKKAETPISVPAPATDPSLALLTEIRDLLRKKEEK